MPCYHPQVAYRSDSGLVAFCKRGQYDETITLPCGQCVGCRLERSRQWAMRMMHEAKCHDANWFVTLTYDDEHLPVRGSLDYRDWQLFAKRLRKRAGPFRFFTCGEYGAQLGRPHFHAAIFGLPFRDRVLWARGSCPRETTYTSALISSCWPSGQHLLGGLTFESAAYIARYIVDKVNGDLAEKHYSRFDEETGEVYQLEPELAHMSLKPAIGRPWFDRFHSDVYPGDYVVSDGRKSKPPRYYDKLLKRASAAAARGESSWCSEFAWDDVQVRRELEAAQSAHDNVDSRLVVKEAVALAALKLKSRHMEFSHDA